MSSLKRVASGAFKARKRIPTDVRVEYQALYGPAYEAKLTIPAGTTPQGAKALHAEWLADGEGRIATLRGRNGFGADLTQRQAATLAGDWYRWFIDQHIENPGRPSYWAELYDVWWNSLIDVAGDPETGEIDMQAPEVREELHPLLAHDGQTDKFLTDSGVVLTEAGRASFLSAVLSLFLEALKTLQRRAAGDWSPDKRLEALPPPQPIGAVLKVNRSSAAESKALSSATALFEAYCLQKKSAPSTVSRWRPVFAALDALPEPVAHRRQAQAWLDGLQTPDRSARTVHDIWLSAARSVYRWALRRHLIESNPFEGCVVDVPRQVTTRETGRAFTEAEARTLLLAAQLVPLLPIGARGSEWAACRRWVPWLCAYNGARAGELTQSLLESDRRN